LRQIRLRKTKSYNWKHDIIGLRVKVRVRVRVGVRASRVRVRVSF